MSSCTAQIEPVVWEGVAHRITLCECTPADQDFLLHLFARTHRAEFAGLHLPETQLTALLHMQFMAQDHDYRGRHPDAHYLLVLLDDAPAGRMVVHETEQAVRLIDIALLPEAQQHGIGTALLKALCAHADALTLPIRLHVTRSNPAQRLYTRLGFDVVAGADQTDVYLAMQRRATTQATV